MGSITDLTELLGRFNRLKSRQLQWKSLFDEAYQYSQPNRNLFDDVVNPGQKKNIEVYDITPVISTIAWASKIENGLNPPDSDWFSFEAPQISGDESERTKFITDLQIMHETILYYINKSNFYLASYESAFDLAIGTAAIMVLEGDENNPLNFQSVPTRQFYPEENSFGTIDTVWREFPNVKKRDVLALWPNAKISATLDGLMKNSPEDMGHNFLEGTLSVGTPSRPEFRYIVMHPQSGSFLIDELTPSSSWIVYRWGKLPIETYGRGPIINALPTIRTLNKALEFDMRGAAIRAMPPWVGFDDNIFNPWTAVIEPNAMIPINRSSVGAEPLRALNIPGDVSFAQLIVQDLRQQINELMFHQPLGPVDTPVKTATEITIRQKELLEIAAPAITRLQQEKLTPLLNRCAFILQKKGLLPRFVVDGTNVKATYQSPLQESRKIENIQNLNNLVRNLQEFLGPQLTIQMLKTGKLPEYLAEQYNVDLELINTAEELQHAAMQLQAAVQQQEPQLQAPGQIQAPPV